MCAVQSDQARAPSIVIITAGRVGKVSVMLQDELEAMIERQEDSRAPLCHGKLIE